MGCEKKGGGRKGPNSAAGCGIYRKKVINIILKINRNNRFYKKVFRNYFCRISEYPAGLFSSAPLFLLGPLLPLVPLIWAITLAANDKCPFFHHHQRGKREGEITITGPPSTSTTTTTGRKKKTFTRSIIYLFALLTSLVVGLLVG